MSMKKWRVGMALALASVVFSSASFAGYDTRGGYDGRSMQCTSSRLFQNVSNACIARCNESMPAAWEYLDGFHHYKNCYLRCEQRMLSSCESASAYPKQRNTPPPV